MVNGVKYVEAYPIHFTGGELDYISLLQAIPPFHLITIKHSRSQARKLAYKLWIDSTGKGYNTFPFSPPSHIYISTLYNKYYKRSGLPEYWR